MPRSFSEILAAIPLDVKRVHHGRDPSTGFDCVGLPLYVYREAGWPLDDADLAYSEDGADEINRAGTIEQQLSGRLVNVTQKVAWGSCEPGDIWVLGSVDGLRHVGVFSCGSVYHMAAKLEIRDAVRIRPLSEGGFQNPPTSQSVLKKSTGHC